MNPTSLVRLLWFAKLIFGVTVKESTKCHLGLTEAESNVWLRECNSSECHSSIWRLYLWVPGDERRLTQELFLWNGPEIASGKVLRWGTGLQIILPPQPPQPEQLAVTPQRVPSEAQRERQRPHYPRGGQDACSLEDRVRRKLLELVGSHVQPLELLQPREGALWDVAEHVVVQIEGVETGHPLNGHPRRTFQVVVG